MVRSRVLLGFLLIVSLFPCVNTTIQTALAAVEHALMMALDALTDAVSSSDKQCSNCKDAADPDCVLHIVTNLTDEATVLKHKVNRLQSAVQCDCSYNQVFNTEGRDPGFIVYDQGSGKMKVIAPNGTVITDKQVDTTLKNFYYNPLTEKVFTSNPFKSFNMTLEDEHVFPKLKHYGLISSFAGDPFTKTLYYTEYDTYTVEKVGMDGMGQETLSQLGTSILGGTLDISQGVFYFGDANEIKSVNVQGDPKVITVGQFTTDIAIENLDIDAEAQKLYFCSSNDQYYVFDLVTKTHNSTSAPCTGMKVWNGFIYFIARNENAVTKMNIEDGSKEKIYEGLFSSNGWKSFTLF